jgi:hypothetical protein
MKFAILRKQLMVESALAVAVLAVIGGGTYFIDTVLADYTSRRNAAQAQVSAVTNETNGLREKFIRIQKDKGLYERVMTLSNSDMLSHTPAVVNVKLKEYQDQFGLKWTIDTSTLKPALEDAAYKKKTHAINLREGVFKIDSALSDEDVFQVMQLIQRDFPGAVSYRSLMISREATVSDATLRTITQTGTFPLVRAELKFDWYGIDPVDPEEAKRQAASRTKRRPR